MRKYQIAERLGRAEQYVEELTAENRQLRGRAPEELDAGWAMEKDQPKKATGALPDDARIPVLAVALMLKNRADAMDVAEGSHIPLVLEQYDRVEGLYRLLGATTAVEHDAAVALWEETAA